MGDPDEKQNKGRVDK